MFTQVSSDGAEITSDQWAIKGSYRLEQLLKTIKELPNRKTSIFTQANYAIYVLDSYAVHLMPEVRVALWERGYVLVIIGGGITGFMQVNDTHLNRLIRAEYRKEEAKLMLEKLREKPAKIPALERDDMMNMLALSVRNVNQNLNIASAFKSVWVTNALDGSDDNLVSDRIFGGRLDA